MLPLTNQNFAAVSPARISANPASQPENIRLIPSLQLGQLREYLPLAATPNDLRELIRFLRQRPEGISVIEALSEVKKRLLDQTKIKTYEQWGVISKQGDWLKLSGLGWEFSKKLSHEAELFRTILDRIEPYRAMLAHAQFQRLSLIAHDDVVKYWRVHFPHSVDWQNLKTIEASVVSFLHVCQSAELGSLTIGKRGQPARLKIDAEDLNFYVTSTRRELIEEEPHPAPRRINLAATASSEKVRLYLSVEANSEEFIQLQSLLEMLGFKAEIIERNSSNKVPLSEKIFDSLRHCEAGLIVITEADCLKDEMGFLSLIPEIQMEISAAYLFYDRRVILLCAQQIQMPAYLQNIPTCALEKGKLDWKTGLAIAKALSQFKPAQ